MLAPGPGEVLIVTAPSTWPDNPRDWKLWLIPCTSRQVNAFTAKLGNTAKRKTPRRRK